jgi:hypothetical protein
LVLQQLERGPQATLGLARDGRLLFLVGLVLPLGGSRLRRNAVFKRVHVDGPGTLRDFPSFKAKPLHGVVGG